MIIKLINFTIWKISRLTGNYFNTNWPYYLKNCNLLNKKLNKYALLYYKTDPFILIKNDYLKHTNNWEIKEIVKILNRYGFLVDIIDRDIKKINLIDKYKIFIGNGSGPSGKRFKDIALQVPSAIKILLANSPNYKISDRNTYSRYLRFNKKYLVNAKPMRVRGKNFPLDEFVKYADYICVCGYKDEFAGLSYKKYDLPILSYYPSSKPINLNYSDKNRSKKDFLCFAGDGFIAKGVDLVVEAFLKNKDLNLYICGPTEPAFDTVFADKIKNANNIFFEGFISVGGKRFIELINKCTYTVLASCSESCATSVTTVMQYGLIPIITKECSIKLEGSGFIINENDNQDLIKKLNEILIHASKMNIKDIKIMRKKVLKNAKRYTQQGFRKTMSESINTALLGKI